MNETILRVIRLIMTPKFKIFITGAIQAICLGFDSSFFVFYSHELFSNNLLTVIITIFYIGVFIGSCISSKINQKLDYCLLLFYFSLLRVIFQFITVIVAEWYIIFVILYLLISLSIGIIFSTLISFSIKKMTNPDGSMFISIIYASFALGTFISSLILERNNVILPIHPRTKVLLPMYPKNSTSLSEMNIHSRLSPNIILIGSILVQILSIYPFYSLWKTKTDETVEDDEYNNIDGENKNIKKIIFLSSFIGFLMNGLYSFYPYFLFGFNYDKYLLFYYIIFTITYLIGRVIFITICHRKDYNVVLSFSFVLCGFSICIYSFEPARVISSALYGIGLSMINPVLTVYIKQISKDYIHVFISAITLSPFIFTLPLTLLLNYFGPQLFTSINFLILILTVFFFVWLLNIQSKMDKPEGENAAKIWWFFRGEGALKRTRSIRKFIGSIRGSIRGRRYRRMQGAASPLNSGEALSPTHLHVRRSSPNRLSPNSYGARTYRSTQSRQVNAIEIEEESSSAATITTPTL